MKKFKLIATSLLASTMVLAGCGESKDPHEHTFESKWTSDASYHWHEATCGHDVQGGKGEHSDGDRDHKCDVCEKIISSCVDNNHDNLCDICGADMPRIISVAISGAPAKLMETKSAELKVNVQAKGNANKAVTWTASNSNATVDQNGVVTGVKAGSVTITATSDFDNTKFASVNIEIVELYWTDEELAMFAEVLPEPIPFMKGSFEVTDYYVESAGCVCLISSDPADLTTAKTVLASAEGWEDLGSFQTQSGLTIFNYSKASVDDLGYETYVQAYLDQQGLVNVDCYYSYIEYYEWPAEQIASYATLVGFDGAEVKAFPLIEDAYVTAAPEKLTSGGDVVYITVSDGYSYASDYADLYDPSEFIVVYYDEEVTISPLDKSYTIYGYDTQAGFDLILTDYIPDERFGINEQYEMVAVGDSLQLTLVVGADIDTSVTPVQWFVSGDNASIDQTGLLTVSDVGEGYVVVTAAISDEIYAQTQIYTVAEVPEDFTDAQKAEFSKIHEGLLIPFNKYLDNVEYNEDGGFVEAYSSMYSAELENYYDALIADGWVDTIAEQYGEEISQLYYAFGYPFMFEKKVNLEGKDYWVSLQLSCLNVYLDPTTGEQQLYYDYEGILDVVVYDDYFYDYDDAMLQIYSMLYALGVETDAEFPENLPASHYFVEYYEEDEEMEEPEYIAFGAYDVGATLEQITSAFEDKGWLVETYHVDEEVDVETGDTYPAYDEIYALSEDGILELEGSFDGDLYFELYFGEAAEEFDDTVTFSEYFSDQESADEAYIESDSGAGIEFSIGSGSVVPKYYANGSALRVYGGNTITFYAPEDGTLSEIIFDYSGSKDMEPDVGSFDSSTGIWTAGGEDVTEVTFTIETGSGNNKIKSVEIIGTGYGSGGGGGGGQSSEIEDLCDEVSLLLFGEEGYFFYDSDYDTYYAYYEPQTSTLLGACSEVADKLADVYFELQAPAEDEDEDGPYALAAYTDDNWEYIIQVVSFEDEGETWVEVDIYVWED